MFVHDFLLLFTPCLAHLLVVTCQISRQHCQSLVNVHITDLIMSRLSFCSKCYPTNCKFHHCHSWFIHARSFSFRRINSSCYQLNWSRNIIKSTMHHFTQCLPYDLILLYFIQFCMEVLKHSYPRKSCCWPECEKTSKFQKTSDSLFWS